METIEETIRRMAAELAKLQYALATQSVDKSLVFVSEPQHAEAQTQEVVKVKKSQPAIVESDDVIDDASHNADSRARSRLRLKLSTVAKSSGGDKYMIDGDLGATVKRDRAIYVPQNISRRSGKPSPTIEFEIRRGSPASSDAIAFTMVKAAAGSGDDRYTSKDKEQWKNDIYLPKSVGGSVICLEHVDC
jgi:hypothetical protein